LKKAGELLIKGCLIISWKAKSNDKAKEIYHKNSWKSMWFRFAFSFEKIFKSGDEPTIKAVADIFCFSKWQNDGGMWKVNGIVYSTLESLEVKMRLYRIPRLIAGLENQPISHVNTVNLMVS
jgi:hypothetical protein